jgi:hypothetical protein
VSTPADPPLAGSEQTGLEGGDLRRCDAGRALVVLELGQRGCVGRVGVPAGARRQDLAERDGLFFGRLVARERRHDRDTEGGVAIGFDRVGGPPDELLGDGRVD